MVREIRGAKINPKSSFKNDGAQNTRGRKLREQIRYYLTAHLKQKSYFVCTKHETSKTKVPYSEHEERAFFLLRKLFLFGFILRS